MNKILSKQSLKQMLRMVLLVVALVAPWVIQAQQQVEDTQTENNTLNILNFMTQHMKNDELVQAMINYEAAARINDYQYNQQLLFMAAPGSIWAVTAGGIVGASHVSQAALKIGNSVMLASVQPYSLATNFSGPLTNGPASQLQATCSPPTMAIDNVYCNYVAPFVTSGDTTGLTIFNLGQFIESDNLTNAGIAQQSQLMINMVLNPFPAVDPNVQSQISAAGGVATNLTAAAQESIAQAIANNAILSVSISALSDIVSRRTPGTDNNGNPLPQSVMEIMNQYSSQRFTNSAWYTQMSTASDTALLREISHMLAYSTWMQFQEFRVQEQQMALLATMNAMMTKMNASIEQLNAQMAKASAQAQQAAQQQAAQQAAANNCPTGQAPNGQGGCICSSGPNAGNDASGGC